MNFLEMHFKHKRTRSSTSNSQFDCNLMNRSEARESERVLDFDQAATEQRERQEEKSSTQEEDFKKANKSKYNEEDFFTTEHTGKELNLAPFNTYTILKLIHIVSKNHPGEYEPVVWITDPRDITKITCLGGNESVYYRSNRFYQTPNEYLGSRIRFFTPSNPPTQYSSGPLQDTSQPVE